MKLIDDIIFCDPKWLKDAEALLKAKKNNMLTKQQKEYYINHGGCKCPHCKTEDIWGGSVEVDADYCSQSVTCHNCEKDWTDTYQLVDILES